MRKLLHSAVVVAVLISGTNVNAATTKAKSSSNQKQTSKSSNQRKKSSRSTSSGKRRDGLLGITNGKWKTNATAVLGLNSGIEALRGNSYYGGPGINIGIGYQFIYAIKTDYSLYGNAEFQYDFFAGLVGTGENKINMLGVKLRIGLAFMEESLKAYFTLGLMGVIPSGDGALNNGFAALFGLGISQDIIKRRLAIMLEFEGGPTAGITGLEGAMILRLGVRGMF